MKADEEDRLLEMQKALSEVQTKFDGFWRDHCESMEMVADRGPWTRRHASVEAMEQIVFGLADCMHIHARAIRSGTGIVIYANDQKHYLGKPELQTAIDLLTTIVRHVEEVEDLNREATVSGGE
jgi:hypothetical protein